MLKHYPDHLRHMDRCVEIAKLPIHERGTQVAALKRSAPKRRTPSSDSGAEYGEGSVRDSYNQVWLRSAYVALACERYRLRHQEWPTTLDVLVKEKLLAAVPLDPMDGQPMRYRRTTTGVVVYSVGSDLIDNHGNIERERVVAPARTGASVCGTSLCAASRDR